MSGGAAAENYATLSVTKGTASTAPDVAFVASVATAAGIAVGGLVGYMVAFRQRRRRNNALAASGASNGTCNEGADIYVASGDADDASTPAADTCSDDADADAPEAAAALCDDASERSSAQGVVVTVVGAARR
jgi:hypothetical protein